MRLRGARPIGLGLAASVLLHAGLLATVKLDWPLARVAAPPPIELRLQEQVRERAVPPPPKAALVPPRPASPQAEPASEQEASAVDMPEPAEAAAPAVEAGPAMSSVPPVDPGAATEPAKAQPVLNPLPHRIDLEYRLSVGPASGRQTLVWVNEGDRYTVTSVAEATGLARMFYPGRFIQTSHGSVTARGLQPEAFWDQRGDRRSSAHFEPASGTLTLTPADGVPRHFENTGDVQDVLSLLFQFALTAPPPDGHLAYRVFNGKKLRDYTYEVGGEEMLETALGELRTLHLARLGGDGRFEVWLAIDRHYLPVRILRVEESGAEGELTIARMVFSE